MKCNHCGQDLIQDAKFCNHCGQPVTVELPQSQPQPQPQPNQSNTYYNPAFNGSMPPPPPQPVQPVKKQIPGKGLGIAGMIVGIASLVYFLVFYISIPAAIAGLIMSIISINKAKEVGLKNGMPVAGMICSIIALALSTLFAFILGEYWIELFTMYY